MPTATGSRAARLFVILNPAAGSCKEGEVHAALDRHFGCPDGSCEVHQTTGADDLAGLARAAAGRGCDVVVAAGGDGTVSAVAGGLVGTDSSLGILPLGTGNILARELGIPVELEAAVALLASGHARRTIDAMRAKGRHFFTQIGIGIDALMIRDTSREQKRRFGRLAYMWTAITRLMGFQPRVFRIDVGGGSKRFRASQVLLANSATLGQAPFTWGPDIRLDDGRVTVLIVRARTFGAYLSLAWNFLRHRHRDDPNVRYLEAEGTIRVETDRPLPVQADGEVLCDTPIEVEVVPGALRVVVPAGSGAGESTSTHRGIRAAVAKAD
jgi:YegS/Rv2252/BmrU family lipid kinase